MRLKTLRLDPQLVWTILKRNQDTSSRVFGQQVTNAQELNLAFHAQINPEFTKSIIIVLLKMV